MVQKSEYRVSADRVVLGIIDIQERVGAAMPPDVLANVVRNAGILVSAAGELGYPIIVTEQYPKGLGPTVEPLREALKDIKPIEKVEFSCCENPAFMQALDALGDRDIILTGMEAHVCLLQTAIDLLANGRRVFIVSDALCSRSKQNWRLALNWMERAGAWIGSTEMLVFQMVGRAGTPTFKNISRMVK